MARARTNTKAKKITFDFETVNIVTPKGSSEYLKVLGVDDLSEKFGGKILFTEDDLSSTVTVKRGGSKDKVVFGDYISELLDEAVEQVKPQLAKGKKIKVVDKLKEVQDDEGNTLYSFSCSSKYDIRVVGRDKKQMELESELGNGSVIRANVIIEPYSMPGDDGVVKVGLVSYLNSIQVLEIVEYSSDDMFDDEDESDDDIVFDDDDEATADAGDF